MELSKRLQAIADEVTKGSSIADIGTDHGYVPIYLAKNHQISKGIAMDIGKGPLERAKKNIEHYHTSDVIEVRQSDGLRKLTPGEVDTLIIAGMGGLLMRGILEARPDVLQETRRLILQPQRDEEALRYFLHDQGFVIEREQILKEDGRYYVIITASIGDEKYEKEAEYLFGKQLIDTKDSILEEYISYQLKACNKLLHGLLHQKSDKVEERKKELKQYQKICKEVLQWFSQEES